ncbi:unnamed protein product, partial [Mesorhabditis belari]|uniref:Carbohydrate sulfotransferase n=1 Tax=Mesorhabditis belari TaxID=2138241 RepID=A0AAF3J6A2_9BILA
MRYPKEVIFCLLLFFGLVATQRNHWRNTKIQWRIVDEQTGNTTILTPIAPGPERSCYTVKIGKLHFSSIPKNMSRMMKRILCELTMRWKGLPFTKANDERLDSNDLKTNTTGLVNFCVTKKFFKNTSKRSQRRLSAHAKSTKFFIWRDPVDRFKSMYTHLCVDNNFCGVSGESISKFAKANYDFFQNGIDFPGITKDDSGTLKHHMKSHIWYCDLREDYKSYHLVKYSSDPRENIAQLEKLFVRSGFPRDLSKKVLSRMDRVAVRTGEKNEKLHEKWKQEILDNPTTLSYVLASYYYDYQLFGMEMPVVKE